MAKYPSKRRFFLVPFLLCLLAVVGWRPVAASDYDHYNPIEKDASSTGFETLQHLNQDVCGWISIDGTKVDYPLLQSRDNIKYLDRNAFGDYAVTGSIFLDYRFNPNFTDFNTIIYGHSMASGAMFGEIKKFAEHDFFDQHRYGSLYYNGRERGLEIFGILEVDAYDSEIYRTLGASDEDHQSYYQYLLSKAKYKRDVSLTSTDKIVLLSTCFLNITNGRHVLLAKITDTPVKPVEKEAAKPVASRYFGNGIAVQWLYLLAFLLLMIVLLLLIVIFLLLKKEKRDKRNSN
ncbi:NPQTN specific sortase B [Streptococcus oralis]|uniref:NPQTN specific sortase B n=1 Tax=Streptococcus oralis TaxID=1303 RepID=A0A139RNJ0_STROR|nr:class B sortase [Streptococcus oralis]KXU16342.1 NPQTN specific sortase B [Streptococcus oralis]